MLGYPFPQDRQIELRKGDFCARITEYNDELTGFEESLSEIDPDVFHYGGNAYYIRTKWAPRNGYTVTELDRSLPLPGASP